MSRIDPLVPYNHLLQLAKKCGGPQQFIDGLVKCSYQRGVQNEKMKTPLKIAGAILLWEAGKKIRSTFIKKDAKAEDKESETSVVEIQSIQISDGSTLNITVNK